MKSGKIFSVFSLAASGIIHRVDNYTHVLPAIKIDILAVDVNYQKIHFDEESEKSKDGDDHYYLSDHIMCEIIKKCRYISENYVSAKYIILYADQKARRYYERNYFYDFGKYMEKEHNMEVMENYPMYMELE